jgi:hypothetical protein
MYFTTDFEAAKRSVQMLAKLEPELVVTGHGRAMHGPEMRTALHMLADNFDEYAVPKNGRYVKAPAVGSDGSAYRQPSPSAYATCTLFPTESKPFMRPLRRNGKSYAGEGHCQIRSDLAENHDGYSRRASATAGHNGVAPFTSRRRRSIECPSTTAA